ncbi:MAG: hypothetical protein J6N54_03695, partial [Bacteroidales bacterium]|nr:hypothetical protein [Bacteroidales bacterium]
MNKKNFLITVAFGLFIAASCANNASTNVIDDFTDRVTDALNSDGKVDWNKLAWTREPASYSVSGDTLF